MRENFPVTGRSVDLSPDANILSTTTPDSHITHVNPDFIEISGFTEEELLGQPHNIVRHPDMPPAVFGQMWATLKAGQSWMGLVKNRCKNGDHYWVSAYVTPITRDGTPIEFQSVRTRPEPEHVNAAETLYARIRSGKAMPRSRFLSFGLKLQLLIWGGVLTGLLAAAALTPLSIRGALVAGLVAGGVVAAGTAVLLAPFRRLVRRARAVAVNPLSQLLYTGRGDEFGQIEFALRMMQAETGAIVGRISDAANRLGEHARRLLHDIESTKQLSVEQRADTEQVAAAVGQLAESIQVVAQNTMRAAAAAGAVDSETASGQQLVAATSNSMTELEEEIRRAVEVIGELEAQSNEITGVLDVIQEITEQTSLLALNAAIEAARAGEQGRGFAVVADEVRNLAARTQHSTMDIQTMIATLQERARSAVAAMENSSYQAAASVSHAREAAEALQGISTRISEITEMSAHIADAVEQQRAVSEEINQSIGNIRDAAEGNEQTGQSNVRRATSVARLAAALSELAGQFWDRRN